MKTIFSLILVSLFLFASDTVNGQAKTFTIHGKVISFEESLALEGVSIHIKGTKYYTGTQADGTFSLDVTSDGKILVFELKEYETSELSINEKKEYNIVLKRSNNTAHLLVKELNETVTTAPANVNQPALITK